MKKLLFICMLLFSFVGFAQDSQFSFTKDGFTDFVVTPCEGKTQSELYNKTLDWLNQTYKSNEDILRVNDGNFRIVFEIVTNDLIRTNDLTSTNLCTSYQIEISFTNNAYKFDVLEVRKFTSLTAMGDWYLVPLNTTKPYYNKKGQIKKQFKYYPEMIPSHFNSLNQSLKEFLMS